MPPGKTQSFSALYSRLLFAKKLGLIPVIALSHLAFCKTTTLICDKGSEGLIALVFT
jgi:hypothetical protein